MSIVVDVHEAKTHFSRLLEQAHAGQEILLAKAGKPYARLMPLERGTTRRQAGRLQGRVTRSVFRATARGRSGCVGIAMKYIFDTHALLWWWTDDPARSPRVRDLIADEANEFLVSAASAWDIAAKYRWGKLRRKCCGFWITQDGAYS